MRPGVLVRRRWSGAAVLLVACASPAPPVPPVSLPPAQATAIVHAAPTVPPEPAGSLPRDGVVDAVSYDAALDAMTLCPPTSATDPRCARLAPGSTTFVTRPQSIPSAVRAPNLVMGAARGQDEPPPLRRRGDRVLFDGVDRWVDLPARSRATMPVQPPPKLFWISRDGSRALVWRFAAASDGHGGPIMLHADMLELVDPIAHRVIARDETCSGYFGLGDLGVDADERALLVGMQQDMAGPHAVVDLVHGRFGAVRDGLGPQHAGNAACTDYTGSNAWDSGREPPGILAPDVASWRTPAAVVALDTGRLISLVTGDFPLDTDAIEYVVDASTSVVVAPAKASGPGVCTGVLHRTEAPPGTPAPSMQPLQGHGEPRCVPATRR